MLALIDGRDRVVPAITSQGAARQQLRQQITRLECELTQASSSLRSHRSSPDAGRRSGRLLGLAELEIERDHLVGALSTTREQVRRQASSQEAARARLEEMLAHPRRFKFAQVTVSSLGLPGCGVYRCRPRLGLVGMLAGWWEVKLSSGCP